MPKVSNKILSCFIDETGDFGIFDSKCPYYMVSVVLHDQTIPISSEIEGFEKHLSNIGFPHHGLHAGPLLRREQDYLYMNMEERKKLFNLMVNFTRKLPIKYFCVKVKKVDCHDTNDLYFRLDKAITNAIYQNLDYFNAFDKIILYYDNGQKALKRILKNTFNALLSNVEVRKIAPSDYKLFQVADLICTLELTKMKYTDGTASKSEHEFFHGMNQFKKDYLRKIECKHM